VPSRGEVASRYGLYLPDKGFSVRATVIVDQKGKVAWVRERDLSQARDDKAILESSVRLADAATAGCAIAGPC
jgi:alkyl hydroperoxide reductase subunit AhpC